MRLKALKPYVGCENPRREGKADKLIKRLKEKKEERNLEGEWRRNRLQMLLGHVPSPCRTVGRNRQNSLIEDVFKLCQESKRYHTTPKESFKGCFKYSIVTDRRLF